MKTKESGLAPRADRLKLEVTLLLAKPNPQFPAWVTERTRFLRFSEPVACAECGKRSKHHWTMLCEFQAPTMAHQLVLAKSGKLHAPLTGVCRKHLIAPEIVRGTP
jgi:hypothetical protein